MSDRLNIRCRGSSAAWGSIARRAALGLLALGGAVLAGCHKPEPAPPPDQASPAATAPTPPPPAAEPSTPSRPDVGPIADDRERWLFVETPDEGKPGGWAEGDFDPQRNKLDIRTHDVLQFAVDTARIRIDWQKLVILSIDGKTSELKRRDFSLYRFRRDAYGQWVVLEP